MPGAFVRLRRGVSRLLRGRTDGRFRATWRVVLPILLAFVGTAVFGLLIARTTDAGPLGRTVSGHLATAVAVTGVLFLSARALDDRSVTDYGLDIDRGWAREFAGGAALGTAMVGATAVIGYLAGWVRVVDTVSSGDAGSLAPWLALFVVGWLCVGYWEEVLFRGIFVTNAVEGLSARSLSPRAALAGGWLASTVVFGVIHVPFGNVPGQAHPVTTLAFWVLMGGLLGLGYVLTGRLALPIGLHAAFDLAANNVFYAAPADGVLLPTLVRSEIVARGLMNPIAGIPGVVVVLCGYGVLAGWCYLGGRDPDAPRPGTPGRSRAAD